jgi:hypothetical protein
MTKTVQDIQVQQSHNAAEIINSYLDSIDAIRAERETTEGGYLDRLNDEQRMSLLFEQKSERADEANQQALKAYSEEVERYHQELSQRSTHLKKRLFSVDGPDGAAALSRAITATEGELAAYLDVAEQASNEDLARAVFVAAQRRGLGDLMHRYFDEIDQEAGMLYQEWSALPAQEVLERQREGVGRVVQPPDYDRLKPQATVVWS